MTCNCCEHLHKTTGLSTAGLLTVTNSNNIGNFDVFCLLLTICPNSVITAGPAAYSITLNGSNVPVVDMWGYPVITDRLRTRKIYRGRYIVVNGTPHVTLTNIPCGATDVAATIAATSTTSTDDDEEG